MDYDILNGGGGRDLLVVFGGHAKLTGGGGADQVLIGPDALGVVITDFAPTADTLFLPGATALSDLTIRPVAQGMLIQMGTTEILQKGVAASSFHASDIVLHDSSLALAEMNSFIADFHFLT